MPKKRTVNRIYKRAPIIEALIDIHTQLPEKANIDKFAKSLKKEFPKHERINIGTAEIYFNMPEKKSSFSTAQEHVGFKLTSEDNAYVLQVKNNGFTFSLIEQSQYQEWVSFSSHAKMLWDKYVKALKPEKVTRVAVRYINRIDIPALNFNMEDYFETYPRILKGNKSDISGFFLQAQIPQKKEGGMAIINQTITQPPSPGYTSVIFDIDVFDPKLFDPEDKALWKRIEMLRKQKNKLFEDSITDKTRELFV